MIRAILLGISVFLCVSVQGQVLHNSNYSLMTIQTKENKILTEVEGSPYLEKDWKMGVVHVPGKEPLHVYLRYDVSTEIFEIKTDLSSGEVYMLPRNAKTRYEMDGDTFIFEEVFFNGNRISGYFNAHFDGRSYRLLEKPVAEFTEAKKARTGYDEDQPARISIDKTFFLVGPEGTVDNPDIRHRDIKNIFSSEEARAYLDDHRIRSVGDLVGLLEFLEKE